MSDMTRRDVPEESDIYQANRSQWKSAGVIFAFQGVLVRNNIAFYVVGAMVPLMFMYFMAPMYVTDRSDDLLLPAVVPTLILLFNLFLLTHTGMQFYDEVNWGTWQYVQQSGVSPGLAVLAKSAGIILVSAVQCFVQFLVACLLLGSFSWWMALTFAATSFVWATCLVGICLVVVSFISNVQTFSGIANALGPMLAIIGGALVPVDMLPAWARTVSPATPTYWAKETMVQSSYKNPNLAEVGTSLSVLAAFALGLVLVGVLLSRRSRIFTDFR